MVEDQFSAAKKGDLDAGREAQQNRSDVEMGLKTLSDHFQELGADFGEEIERRASDAKLILETAAKYGVPVDMLWKPSGGSVQQDHKRRRGDDAACGIRTRISVHKGRTLPPSGHQMETRLAGIHSRLRQRGTDQLRSFQQATQEKCW